MLRHGANCIFQSVRVRLRFSSTQIIRFSSGSLIAILKNTVRVRLRFDKNSLKPVYKTPVRVRFDSLVIIITVSLFYYYYYFFFFLLQTDIASFCLFVLSGDQLTYMQFRKDFYTVHPVSKHHLTPLDMGHAFLFFIYF